MTWQGRVAWLPCALLLLWGPGWYGQNDAQDRGGRDHPCLVPDEGCSSLSGPTSVTGTVGGSLSVQCQYEEKFRDIAKYWCKSPCVWNTVKTKEADREMRKGRVSIRDHPANLTFTVTLENLTEDDAGTYRCGIDSSWFPGYLLDSTFLVVVFVTPATKSTPPVSVTVTQMSKSTAKIMTTLAQPSSAAPTTMGATRSASSQEEFSPSQGLGLQVLLSLLALLLLLLGGSSLLAWRMVRRQVKYSENLEPLRTPSQATQQGEPHYENLELQMWPLREEPVHPRQAEVEYSTVKAPREELHYSSMVFDLQSGDSKAKKIRSQRTLEETQYGVIKKT